MLCFKHSVFLGRCEKLDKTFHSKDKVETRQLRQEEIEEFAVLGDSEARKELLRQNLLVAKSLQEKVKLIKEFLVMD